MARRRYSRRYRRRSTRWSPNITNLLSTVPAANPGAAFFGTIDLAVNPVQSNQTVSQTFTVKNIELTIQLETQNSSTGWAAIENLTGYIMYVPQGMTVTVDYAQQHPEYIMAYRFIGSPENEADAAGHGVRNPLRVRSRLARKLQTGDSIIFLIVGVNQGSTSLNVNLHGLVRWWTKAN